MTKSPRVTVVGSSMVDLVSYLERCPAPGETVFGKNFAQGFGGKGANQAAMAALLGAQVRFVTCIGRDAFTQGWLDHFADFGIDAGDVAILDGIPSGVASVWVSPEGENMIVLCAGANTHLDSSRVARAFAAAAPAHVVLSQLEVPQSAVAEGFRRGKEQGAITILNPGPAAALEPELVAVTDWLLPNETELRLLASSMGGFTGDDDIALAKQLADALGIDVIVTLGARGAAGAVRGSAAFEVAAPVVTAVDTTGAGDAFAGTFAYALGAGLPVIDAVRLAVAVSADSVTKFGTAVSFSRGDELQSICKSEAFS
ncbi:MAG: ribokinase [Pseudolabrys sp.]|nr:ribokinase [Pseudolabrys sp.]